MVHVPKTIDNDLPLPPDVPTFGFKTAVNLGKDLVKNLMKDAATTDKWFFVTVMGRHAGHLALGIGGSAGATLTIIGEEFPEPRVPLARLVDILEGAIIKRRAAAGSTAWPSSPRVSWRSSTRRRWAACARQLRKRAARGAGAVPAPEAAGERQPGGAGLEVSIVAKDLGYELRCAPPGGFDIQYCRGLGYWATRFLLDGGTEAMATIQGGRLSRSRSRR